MTSKAARIRELYAQGMGTAEIAKVVFETDAPTESNTAYVRTAGRQRREGASPADVALLYKRFGGYTTDEYRKWHKVREKNRYWRAKERKKVLLSSSNG